MDKLINIVCIKEKFSEFNTREIKSCQLEDVIDRIKKPNEENSMYEYLTRNTLVNFFMDIENIPTNCKDDGWSIVEQIIVDFLRFMYPFHIYFDFVAVTKNSKSETHNGPSYHVIFINTKWIEFKNIKFWVYAFLALYPSNRKYVDTIVYQANRMFKLPNQYGVNKDGIHDRTILSNIHVPFGLYQCNYMNLYKYPPKVLKQNPNITDEDLGFFIIQSEHFKCEFDDRIENFIQNFPFDRTEVLKSRVKTFSQKMELPMDKQYFRIDPNIEFKILKYKLLTSSDTRTKFVNDLDLYGSGRQENKLFDMLSPEQLDQLMDIVLSTI